MYTLLSMNSRKAILNHVKGCGNGGSKPYPPKSDQIYILTIERSTGDAERARKVAVKERMFAEHTHHTNEQYKIIMKGWRVESRLRTSTPGKPMTDSLGKQPYDTMNTSKHAITPTDAGITQQRSGADLAIQDPGVKRPCSGSDAAHRAPPGESTRSADTTPPRIDTPDAHTESRTHKHGTRSSIGYSRRGVRPSVSRLNTEQANWAEQDNWSNNKTVSFSDEIRTIGLSKQDLTRIRTAKASKPMSRSKREALQRRGHMVVDSGATITLLTRKRFIRKINKRLRTLVKTATGEPTKTGGLGTIDVRVYSKDGELTAATGLGKAYHSEKLTHSLLSVSQLCANGCTVVFKPKDAYITLPNGKDIGLVKREGLYMLPVECGATGKVLRNTTSKRTRAKDISNRIMKILKASNYQSTTAGAFGKYESKEFQLYHGAQTILACLEVRKRDRTARRIMVEKMKALNKHNRTHKIFNTHDGDQSGEEDYEVDRLMDVRKRKGSTEYKVRWAEPYGDPSHDTWEPEKNILDDSLIEAFKKARSKERKSNPANNQVDKTAPTDSIPTLSELRSSDKDTSKKSKRKRVKPGPEIRTTRTRQTGTGRTPIVHTPTSTRKREILKIEKRLTAAESLLHRTKRKLKNTLYENLTEMNTRSQEAADRALARVQEWHRIHRKLNHPSRADTDHAYLSGEMTLPGEKTHTVLPRYSERLCITCMRSKFQKRVRNVFQSKMIKARRRGQVWHADLVGPFPLGQSGEKYICTFTDAATGYMVAYAMKKKSEAGKCLEMLINEINQLKVDTKRNHHIRRIRRLITDRGGVIYQL